MKLPICLQKAALYCHMQMKQETQSSAVNKTQHTQKHERKWIFCMYALYETNVTNLTCDWFSR